VCKGWKKRTKGRGAALVLYRTWAKSSRSSARPQYKKKPPRSRVVFSYPVSGQGRGKNTGGREKSFPTGFKGKVSVWAGVGGCVWGGGGLGGAERNTLAKRVSERAGVWGGGMCLGWDCVVVGTGGMGGWAGQG